MKATRASKCSGCEQPIKVGEDINKHGSVWVHAACREALVARQQTLDGETFRGTAREYRRKIKRE